MSWLRGPLTLPEITRLMGARKASAPPAAAQSVPAPAPMPVVPAADGSVPIAALSQAAEPTPEQTAVIADLHWLIHQGHVIEFANGVMDTAKKPLPKPPKPEKKAKENDPFGQVDPHGMRLWTDASGKYFFDKLCAGTYKVEVVPPPMSITVAPSSISSSTRQPSPTA